MVNKPKADSVKVVGARLPPRVYDITRVKNCQSIFLNKLFIFKCNHFS